MKKSDYTVPGDYFKHKKLALKHIPERKPNIFSLHPWRSGLSIAASIILIIALGLSFLYPKPGAEEHLNQISTAAIDEFISYSSYAAYPEAYLIEEDTIELEKVNALNLFEEEQIDNYLNQYSNEFL